MQAGVVVCSRPFQLPDPGPLRLTGHFPEAVPAGGQTVSGTLEVTSSEAVRGVSAAAADAFLVRQGRVVTTPLPQDAIGVPWELAKGETRRVPATASLVSCEDREPLAPGDYDLYALLVVTPTEEAPQRAFGGPWRLRVG